MKFRIFFTLLFTLTPLITAQTPVPLDKAKLDQFFDKLAEKNKAMGSIVIARDSKEIYARSIGFGHVAEKKSLTSASKFRIGSITKMFTAALIFQLVEERKLKLTYTLDKFFPQIANASKVTIAHILAHRSGIHDSLLDPALRPASKTEPVSKETLLTIIAKGKPDFDPDTKHQYSNSGYVLLGLIIEKLTGKSYEENLRTRVTAKLGLKDTYFATGNIDFSKNEALSYLNVGGEWKSVAETHPSILLSAGAIISTPSNMAKFISALFDRKIISAENLTLMKTMRDGDGMGMEPFTFADKTFYGHTGGGDNYGAWLAYLPEEKLAIAYTTNAKVYPVKNIMSSVADIYYGKPFQVPSFESFAISTDILDKYVGVYSPAPNAPVKFTITREGSTLFFQPPGENKPVALEATSETTFQIEGSVVIEFDTAKKQMTIKRGGGQRVFTKES